MPEPFRIASGTSILRTLKRVAAFSALLMLMLQWSTRGATWSESYGKGRIALERGRFRNAVAFFTQAIDQKPESKASARTYGANHIDYFPYLYRGIAYAKLGETTLALADLEKERDAGEVFKGMLDSRAVELLRRNLDLLKGTATSAQPPAEKQSPPRNITDSLFKAATDHFNRGQIMRAKTLFSDIRKRDPAHPQIEGYLKRIRAVEQDVKRGISSFLHGRYAEAIEILTPAVMAGADHPHAQAFLGCSYAALHLLTGERVSEQQQKAFEAFRHLKRIDPKYDLDRPFISPAIRDVYAQTPAE